jgi:hypothetical protein
MRLPHGSLVLLAGSRSSPRTVPRSGASGTRSTGMARVRVGVAAPGASFPFSAGKDSFLGDLRPHGTGAVEFRTRTKTVASRWFSSGQGTGRYIVES